MSGHPAITINASPGDKINIIGVVLDGTALTGTTGIQFGSGGSLTVRDSVIRNFTNDGILFSPSAPSPSQLFVSNTRVSDNGNNGINFVSSGGGTATSTGVFNHVEMENNANNGLLVESAQTVNITVTDSVSANNAASGIYADPVGVGGNSIMVRNSTIANNGINGLEANGASSAAATVLVTRSTITGNNTGWAAVSGGLVLSYGDNNIDGNGSANTEPPNPLTYK